MVGSKRKANAKSHKKSVKSKARRVSKPQTFKLKKAKARVSASAARVKFQKKPLKAAPKKFPYAKKPKKLSTAVSKHSSKKSKVLRQNVKKARGKAAKITLDEKVMEAPKKRELSRELQAILSQSQTRHWLIELGGENALDVVKSLYSIPNDEELAKKLKIKVSDVRASLNKLHNEGLVSYIRDKNNETGWYSYAWVVNEDKIHSWIEEKYARQQAYAPQDGIAFYFCKDCGLESAVTFEIAAEAKFKCQTCNSSLDFLDEDKFDQFRKQKETEK